METRSGAGVRSLISASPRVREGRVEETSALTSASIVSYTQEALS